MKLYCFVIDCKKNKGGEKVKEEVKERNKWINGAIPALLLHLSVGSVYAFSLFSVHSN